MLLYKFRGLDNDVNIQRAKDIIEENRFFCPYFYQLNDAYEGSYSPEQDIEEKYRGELTEIKKSKRICSFAKSYNNRLLWAYYAAGFSGLCIEIEVAEENKYIHEVNYTKIPKITKEDTRNFSQEEIVKRILTTKHMDWKKENEIRVITKEEYYSGDNFTIRKVIFGNRIKKETKTEIIEICRLKNIKICEIIIEPEKITCLPVKSEI